MSSAATDARYIKPGRFVTPWANRVVMWLVGRGVSVWGARVLEVQGRRSGLTRRVAVNLLTVDGVDYLVAPRGETEWVRNLRAAGSGRLVLGRRATGFDAVEVAVAERPAVLRPYLRRWRFEVGIFFDGVDADSTEAELAAIAHRHPVFRLVERGTEPASSQELRS